MAELTERLGLPLLVVLGPASIVACLFLWKLHADDRQEDNRSNKPLFRLSFILAVTGTLGAFGTTVIAIAALLSMQNQREMLVTLRPLLIWGINGLCLISIINAAYLAGLRRGRKRRNGRATPPPWSRED